MGPLSPASIGLQAGESKSDQSGFSGKCDYRVKKDRAGARSVIGTNDLHYMVL